MKKAAAIILALEAVVLAIAIVAFLANENDNVRQPTSVPIVGPVATSKVSVPVSVNLKSVGTVKTAELARGGRTSDSSTSEASGTVAVRP